MRFDAGALGSAALVGARKSAELTQEELAHRTGLSVRAIRDLETGRVRSPRRTTIDLLASALEMEGGRAEAFAAGWTTRHSRLSFAEMLASGYDVETLLALRGDGGYSDVIVFEKLIIGPSRRLVRSENFILSRYVANHVSSRLVAWGDDDVYSPSLVRMESVGGAETASRIVLEEQNLAVFELAFGREMAIGDVHAISYHIVLDDPDPQMVEPSRATRDAVHGFRRPVGTYALQVVFEGCPAPSQAWEVLPIVLERRRGEPVPVIDNGLEYVRTNAAAGFHGLLWEW